MQIRIILTSACGLALAASGLMHAANLSKADRQFLVTAATTDMTQAHEAQMAESQANRDDVKSLAKSLAQDHTDSYEQLTMLAAKTGVDIPKGINTAKIPAVAQLTHAKGAAFDRDFTHDAIAVHRARLAMYKREAEHGQDPDVKAYAAKMIPVAEKHLQQAEACAKPVKHS